MSTTLKSFEKYRNKEVILAWSGGLDSTAILLALTAVGANVTAITVEGHLTGSTDIESRVRREIRNHVSIKQRVIKLDVSYSPPGSQLRDYYRLPQIPIWLNMLSLSVTPTTDHVMLGYVLGDQANSYTREILAIWKQYGKFTHPTIKHPSLVIPLLQYSKYEVRELLRDALSALEMPEYLNRLTWSCEAPYVTGEVVLPCGYCRSCTADRSELGLDIVGLKSRFISAFSTLAEYADFMKLSSKTGLVKKALRKRVTISTVANRYTQEVTLLSINVESTEPTSEELDIVKNQLLKGSYPAEYYLPLRKILTNDQIPDHNQQGKI